MAQGNDLKKLMKWIMLSEPYSLSSKMTPNNKKDDPSMGVKPAFSHFYMRAIEAEQLYESIETRSHAERGQDIDWARRCKSGTMCCRSSRLPSVTMKVARRRPSTARFRKR